MTAYKVFNAEYLCEVKIRPKGSYLILLLGSLQTCPPQIKIMVGNVKSSLTDG